MNTVHNMTDSYNATVLSNFVWQIHFQCTYSSVNLNLYQPDRSPRGFADSDVVLECYHALPSHPAVLLRSATGCYLLVNTSTSSSLLQWYIYSSLSAYADKKDCLEHSFSRLVVTFPVMLRVQTESSAGSAKPSQLPRICKTCSSSSLGVLIRKLP